MATTTAPDSSELEALRHAGDEELASRLRRSFQRFPDQQKLDRVREEHRTNIRSALASRGDAWGNGDVVLLCHCSRPPVRIPVAALPVTVGRASDATVRIEADDVSRFHCRIERHGALITAVDLDSKNGTYVNGIPVRSQDLCNGDCLQLGTERFVVRRT